MLFRERFHRRQERRQEQLRRQTARRPPLPVGMGQPAFQQWLQAAALNGVVAAGVVAFAAAGQLAYEAVEQQVARTGLEGPHICQATARRQGDDRRCPAQVQQQTGLARMTEDQIIRKRLQRRTLATGRQVCARKSLMVVRPVRSATTAGRPSSSVEGKRPSISCQTSWPGQPTHCTWARLSLPFSATWRTAAAKVSPSRR